MSSTAVSIAFISNNLGSVVSGGTGPEVAYWGWGVTTPSAAVEAPARTSRWTTYLGLKPIDVADRNNNFYSVRLFLAARVIFGHAFVLGGATLASDASFGHLYNSLGVNGFFVISGFLVTRSLLSSRSIGDYVTARVVRIIPALWIMYLLTVPLVILLGSDTAGSPQTWLSAARYLVENMSIGMVEYQIRGVFEGMLNTAVNGSIWSLRWEVLCYVLLAVLGVVGLARRPFIVPLIATLLVVAIFALSLNPIHEGFQRRVTLIALFFFGSTLAVYAEKLMVGIWFGIACVVVAGAVGYFTEAYDLVYFAFGYLLISIAYSKVGFIRAINNAVELRTIGKPDLSYGIFLYSFPIQQLLYYNKITSSPVMNIALTIVLASLCAYFSSECIEKPTTALRKRFSSARAA